MKKVANNLYDYIECIKSLDDTFYYRGENDKYSQICSSLLRNNKKILNEKNRFIYENLVNEYYNEVALNITDYERNNFLAFSQHHGLNTNLVDFTSSPLTALFFACDGAINKKGFVYAIEKNNTINISFLVNDYFKMPIKNCNILSLIASDKNTELTKYLNAFFKSNPTTKYFHNASEICKKLNEDVKHAAKFTSEYFNIINNPENFNTNMDKIADLLSYHSNFIMDKNELDYVDSFDTDIYLNLLIDFFIILENFENLQVGSYSKLKFPDMPYFVYQTPFKFDRIKNQEGIFFYQLYYIFKTKHFANGSKQQIITQPIYPKHTIEIHNQEGIMKELDFIGINRKMIYGDCDNIASYLNKKML